MQQQFSFNGDSAEMMLLEERECETYPFRGIVM
jgi:hypothetical protein